MAHKIINKQEYQYGFNDKNTSIIAFKKGLSIDVIKKISAIKQEPK
jgi:hypothetical protein